MAELLIGELEEVVDTVVNWDIPQVPPSGPGIGSPEEE